MLVQISGCRVTWEHLGTHGAVWRVNPEHAEGIFACGTSPETPGDKTISSTDRLARAMIKRVTLLESNTNIEVHPQTVCSWSTVPSVDVLTRLLLMEQETVCIVVDGLPPQEFTANGAGVSCFLTGAGHVTTPQTIFSLSGNTELGMAWMQQYPQYTSENLESQVSAHNLTHH